MPAAKADRKPKKKKTLINAARLDIVFSGPLLFVPEIIDGNIKGVEVYSPCNGHPVGAVFLPGVFFTDEELNDPENKRWPDFRSFSLLDPHSYAINLTQSGRQPAFAAASIPDTNHKVKPGRRLSHDWEVAIRIEGKLSAWRTHRLFDVTNSVHYGSDAPKGATVAAVQRLSYTAVSAAEICGASPEPTEYLRVNCSRGGTLIVEGEIPYQSTILHERQAIDALAKLAGLNLHLTAGAPIAGRTRLQGKSAPCLNSIIVV